MKQVAVAERMETTVQSAEASTLSGLPELRLLYSTIETHPTWRSDVRVLFGKYMKTLGIKVDLVALSESDPPAPWPGGKIHSRVDSGAGAGRLLSSTLLQLSLLRRCANDYDVLIVRDLPILSLPGLLAARLAGIPFVYWMSFPLPEAFAKMAREREDLSFKRRLLLRLRGSLGKAMLYHWVLKRADWVFAQSDVMVEELRSKGVRHGRLSAVPMGVDFATPARRPQVVPPPLLNRRIAVYLGTLDRYRHPEIMIDIALLVAKVIPDFMLLVIGEADEPSDRGWLKEQAKQRGAAGHMYFTGRLPFDEAQSMVQLAEVGLSPFPRGELLESASPTKAIEYLAAGIPVVCNDQPDQERVIRESGGGWCVEMSAEGFAQAIIDCMRQPEEGRRMAARGREYVRQKRSYHHLAREVAERIRTVVAARRRPR